jgi:hypothetical protein
MYDSRPKIYYIITTSHRLKLRFDGQKDRKNCNFHKTWHMKLALFLSSLIFFSGAARPFGEHPAPTDDHPTLAIGASAPDFSLPGVDGKTYSL